MGQLADLDFTIAKEVRDRQGAFLDAIDKLRNNNKIDFPQWIVVGDQNTGKSSVMEAITRVQFPVQEGLCTRFPIQLEMRYNLEERVKVKIIPGESRVDYERMVLKLFSRDSVQLDQLEELILDASKAMGVISDPGEAAGAVRHFSDDTLVIHISGPECPSLTILDLPGLYQTSSKIQNEEWKERIKHMVEKRVRQKRSIILLVISARDDYEKHVGPEFIKKIKGAEERTLGVITSPDDTKLHDLPHRIIKNEISDLGIQWHCLRNLSKEEREKGMTLKDRDAQESNFFKGQKWVDISDEHKGIDSLQKKLMIRLDSVIKRDLPRVMTDLNELKDATVEKRKQWAPHEPIPSTK